MSINYTEKGMGLHEAVADAGHWLRQENGVWVASNDAAVQAIIDAYSLAKAKAVKCALVSALAKSLRDQFIAAVSPGEMASWSIKSAEAVKFNDGAPASACPLLSMEASVRGISIKDLVAKVVNSTAIFSAAEATIGGNDGKHRDAINALGSFEDVARYDFSAGWPEV